MSSIVLGCFRSWGNQGAVKQVNMHVCRMRARARRPCVRGGFRATTVATTSAKLNRPLAGAPPPKTAHGRNL
eukprot:4376214-Lingulodinium_polyedra.AAC.1